MITSAQATQYLDQMLGVGAPGFLVDAAVADVAERELDLAAAGYTASTIVRIQCMAVAILVAAGDPKRTSSQGASSGASRSFRYTADDLSKLRRSLAALDTSGVMTGLIGPDPANSGFLMVVC
jgi:hypothetical protein